MKHLSDFSIGIATLSLATVIACAPSPQNATIWNKTPAPTETPPVIPPAVHVDKKDMTSVTIKGGQNEVDFPVSNIIMVIDDSESMTTWVSQLAENIKKFAAYFAQKKQLRYNVGVLPINDTSPRDPKTSRGVEFKFPQDQNGNRYKAGELLYAKDSKGRQLETHFVTEKSGDLAKTLNIKVRNYDQNCPEKEEFFDPTRDFFNAVKTSLNLEISKPFMEKNYTSIIYITDSDESKVGRTKADAAQMMQDVLDFKSSTNAESADKIELYGVLMRKDDPDRFKDPDFKSYNHSECWVTKPDPKDPTKKKYVYDNEGHHVVTTDKTVCPGYGPDIMEEYITSTDKATHPSMSPEEIQKKYILPIAANNFGTYLAQIGKDLTRKVLTKEIDLGQYRPIPDEKTNQLLIKVRYGTPAELAQKQGMVIPPGANGWRYDSSTNKIVISPDVNYGNYTSGNFEVDLVQAPVRI